MLSKKILIEKGNRIQYCSLVEVISQDEEYTTYKIVGEGESRTTSTKQFNKWFHVPNETTFVRISEARKQLTEELENLIFIESFLQDEE